MIVFTEVTRYGRFCFLSSGVDTCRNFLAFEDRICSKSEDLPGEEAGNLDAAAAGVDGGGGGGGAPVLVAGVVLVGGEEGGEGGGGGEKWSGWKPAGGCERRGVSFEW